MSAKKGLPYPLGAGSARPNPKMGAEDPENPLFLGFSVLRGGFRDHGLRPWSRKGPDHGVGVDPETVNIGHLRLVLSASKAQDIAIGSYNFTRQRFAIFILWFWCANPWALFSQIFGRENQIYWCLSTSPPRQWAERCYTDAKPTLSRR